MISEDEILDRLARLFVSAARFEKSGGGRAPGLRAMMAERLIASNHLHGASATIIAAENEMRAHELRELTRKIPAGSHTFSDVIMAIQ